MKIPFLILTLVGLFVSGCATKDKACCAKTKPTTGTPTVTPSHAEHDTMKDKKKM